MALSTKLSVAVHILALIKIGPPELVTSDNIAASVNTNPVVVRRLMAKLKKAGIIHAVAGTSQNSLAKKPAEISLYDVYQAVESAGNVFKIHKNPNPACTIGANIQAVLDTEYQKIQQKMEAELKNISLATVAAELESKIS